MTANFYFNIYRLKNICKNIIFSSRAALFDARVDTRLSSQGLQFHGMFVFSLPLPPKSVSLTLFSAEQLTEVCLFSSAEQSVDVQSLNHSHAPRLEEIPEPLHWNSSLPCTVSHIFALFCVCLSVCVLY